VRTHLHCDSRLAKRDNGHNTPQPVPLHSLYFPQISSATPKEAPINAKDIDMARLSGPANATPKIDRKPSRFRELFRQQSSSSASSSPATLQKSPPPVAFSPLASPYVRPGYEQIGLLPSEQSMHSLQGLGETEVGDGETIGSTAVEESDVGANDQTPIRDADRGSNSNSAKCSHAVLLTESQIDRLMKTPPSFSRPAHDASPKRHAEETGRNSVEPEVPKSQDTSPRAAGDADKRSGLPLGSFHRIAEAMNSKGLIRALRYSMLTPRQTTTTTTSQMQGSRTRQGVRYRLVR